MFKNKDAEYKAKYQKQKARKLKLEYMLYGKVPNMKDFEFAINQRYGPHDGSKTPPGFQAKNKLFESMLDFKVDEIPPKVTKNLDLRLSDN